jgi:hypothetical protein
VRWILQRAGSPERPRRNDWRSRSFCRTREALIRCTREYAGDTDPAAAAVLAALPERIEALADDVDKLVFDADKLNEAAE